jgi:DNA-binding transcriptional LysR family regulator
MTELKASQLLGTMRLTFAQVRSFVTVASTGSFTQAAEVLHLSQPALTARIQQLEEALGLRLLERTTRSVELTDAGSTLLPMFLRLVSEMEGAVLKAREQARRTQTIVRLACLPSCASALLPDFIARFKSQFPDATFVVEDVVNSEVRALVRDRQVDFGIGAYAGEDIDLDVDELCADELQVVIPLDHPLTTVARVTLDELIRHRLILTERGSSIRAAVDDAFARSGFYPAPVCEVNHMSTAVALARAGLGVAILPSTVVEARAAELVTRAVEDVGFVWRLVLIRRKGGGLPRIVQQFIESVITQFRASTCDAISRISK